MENKIKKLIEKYKRCNKIISMSAHSSDGSHTDIIEDLQSLLELYQKNYHANFVIEEVAHKKIEVSAYNRGYDDGYLNRVKGGI